MTEKSPPHYDGEHEEEILTLAGMALYQAQIFEVAMTNLAVGLYMSKRTNVCREDVNAMFDRLGRDTVWKILKEARKYQDFDAEIVDRLTGLVDLRNKFVHSFFRVHDSNITDARGRKIMADELHQIIHDLWRGHMDVERMYATLWTAFGFSEELRETMLEQMRKEAEARWT